MTQALTFTGDFKLGHYMKIPPREMFWALVSLFLGVHLSRCIRPVQITATVIAGTVQLGVQSWMFGNIEYVSLVFSFFAACLLTPNISGMCESGQEDGYAEWTIPSDRVGSYIHFRFTCPDTQVFGAASVIWGESSRGR